MNTISICKSPEEFLPMLLPVGVTPDPAVVIVLVTGGRLVPGIVDAETMVTFPLLGVIVAAGTAEGAITVPGIVVVYVSS